MRLFWISFLFVFINNTYAQNLIANGTFEDVNLCKEFHQGCAPEAWRTVSYSFLAKYLSEKVEKGSINRFVAIPICNTSYPNVRKYLQSQLICPMIKGKSYHLSFDIKPENPILESLGILFSDTLILVEKEKLLNLKPSLDIGSQYSGLSKRKQKEWVKIELDYVATGKEKYIVIGNFQPDNQQVKKYIYKPSPDETYHYYIDNIVLNAPDSLCWCKDSAVRKQRIYDQNERHSFDPLYGIEPVSIDRNAIGNPVEVAEKNDTIRLGDLSFEFNSADLDPVTISTIKTYFENPNLKSISSIDIYGHTDAVGKPKYNLELSKKRAQAVKSVLDDLGLTMFIHDVLGYGNKKPIASNETEDGRKLNRRVEIVVHFENQ